MACQTLECIVGEGIKEGAFTATTPDAILDKAQQEGLPALPTPPVTAPIPWWWWVIGAGAAYFIFGKRGR
jgi:hypothetical protein